MQKKFGDIRAVQNINDELKDCSITQFDKQQPVQIFNKNEYQLANRRSSNMKR